MPEQLHPVQPVLLVCPHAVIRPFLLTEDEAAKRSGRLRHQEGASARSSTATSSASRSARWTAPAAATAPTSARPRTKALDHEAAGRASRTRKTNWEFAMTLPESRPTSTPGHRQGQPVPKAAVRVLRRLRRLRRDALRQAGHPALRRPHDDRQRHRLLLHLRRLRAHRALHHERRRPRPGLGQLACSRTTPSSASA